MRKGKRTITLGTGVALAALLAAGTGWSQNDQNAVNGTQQPAQRNIEMVSAKAELQKGLNAKKLKQGETVTAKLEQTVNLPNEPALEKNTLLQGQVDSVQASQNHSNSTVTVTFTQAKLKDGTVLPLKVTVMRVNEPQDNMGGMGGPGGANAEPAAGPGPGGPASASGTPSPGGPPRAKADEASVPMNTPEPAPSGVGSTQNNGVPGVALQSDIHGSASATFVSKGRNVEVPGGTEMQLAIAAIPKGDQAQ